MQLSEIHRVGNCPTRLTQKIVRVMRLTAILLLATCLTASATVNSQTVTLNLKEVPIQKVFREVIRQTGTSIIYNEAFFKNSSPITIKVKDASVPEVLSECLKDLPFTFDLEGKTIVVRKRLALFKIVQESIELLPLIDVSGKVVDEKGEPVFGATIKIKGTSIIAITNNAGSFILTNVPEDGILVVSSLGYKLKEIKVKKDMGNIALEILIAELKEVEVVSNGYQALPKERATGSFGLISYKKLNEQVSTDVLGRLEAITSGLIVDRSNPINPQIMIRGLSTIQGPKSVLVILDNFPYEGDINNINPNDIESITILKDAAAASIWGARAGNGVIVITTKKAKYNSPLSINFNLNSTFTSKPNLGKIKQISSSDFIDTEKFLYQKGYYDAQISDLDPEFLSPVIELLLARDSGKISNADAENQINQLKSQDIRDQFNKYMYSPGINNQGSISLSGGNQNFSWNSFVGLDDNSSNLNAKYQRLNLRFNNTYRPIKNLEVSSDINLSQSKNRSGKTGYGSIFFKTGSVYPYAQFADDSGNAIASGKNYRLPILRNAADGLLQDWAYYPLNDFEHNINKGVQNDYLINAGLKYKLPLGFSLDVKYQYELQSSENSMLYDKESWFARNIVNDYAQIINGLVEYKVPNGGIYDNTNNKLTINNFRSQINYNRKFGQHELNGLIGSEFKKSLYNSLSFRLYGYDNEKLTFGMVDYTTEFPSIITGYTDLIPERSNIDQRDTRFVSYFTNIAYTYAGKYVASFSARKDGSNLFGVNINNRWNPLWSAGLSWNVSNEKFFNRSLLSLLKIRATYGGAGNIDPSISAVTTIFYRGISSGIPQPYSYFSNYANPSLSWETSNMLNVGIDIESRSGRFNGSVEYYNKRGKNLFGFALLDYSGGVSGSIVKNVAEMKGNGIEFQINTKNLTGAVEWNTAFTLSHYKDKVTKYFLRFQQGSDFISGAGNPSISGLIGKPVYSIFGYRWAGLDPENGDPRGIIGGQISNNFSNLVGSDTKINDLVYFGSAIPTLFGSVGNSLKYRKLELNIQVSYKFGYYFRRRSITYNSLFGTWVGHSDFADRWQKPGDELTTNVPSLTYPSSPSRDAFYAGSEVLVAKGDNIRLQYINLSYNLESKGETNSTFKNITIYCNVSNLGLIWVANKEKLDPDYEAGLNIFSLSKTISFGVRTSL